MNEISGSSYNYNFTTRKIKIAYKRWNKKCKIEGITDIFNTSFMESALFIIALSQKRQEYPEKTFDEIINEVQLQHDSMFEKKQQDMLDYIEKYADAQHLSEHEKSELLTRKKQELVEEKRKYEEQRKMKNPFPPQNNEDEEYKNVEYGKDNPSGFAIKVVKL